MYSGISNLPTIRIRAPFNVGLKRLTNELQSSLRQIPAARKVMRSPLLCYWENRQKDAFEQIPWKKSFANSTATIHTFLQRVFPNVS